jgi:citrate lyase subunit beta / citryl-CoA lyase
MTEEIRAVVGSHGPDIRSDCRITLWETPAGQTPERRLESKVAALYGDAIRADVQTTLARLDASGLSIQIEDSGALPFTILARVESAVRRLRPRTVQTALPDLNLKAHYPIARDRLRRTRLYVPGAIPKLFINAGLYRPDAIILDLEDSVAPAEKDAARLLVRNALRVVDFCGAEKMVRVNPLPQGLADIRSLAAHGVHTFVIPKVEQPEDLNAVDHLLDELAHEITDEIYLLPLLESAAGVMNAAPIARASKRVVALTIGLEDYITDIGAQRTRQGRESGWACAQVLNAARAAGLQPLASVFSNVDDSAGLQSWAQEMRMLGFEGIGCLHPRQIPVVHTVYIPTHEEIAHAEQVLASYKQALEQGQGVASLNGKMIDAPIVRRARRTLALAGSPQIATASTQEARP